MSTKVQVEFKGFIERKDTNFTKREQKWLPPWRGTAAAPKDNFEDVTRDASERWKKVGP
jgi:hypothetical protein